MAAADITSQDGFATLEVDATERTFSMPKNVAMAQLRLENIGTSPITIAVHGGALVNTDPASPTQADGERILPSGSQMALPKGWRIETAQGVYNEACPVFTYRAGAGLTSTLVVENIGAP